MHDEETTPPKLTDQVRLDDLLCFAVYSANNAFNRFYKPVMAELGLTYPQFLVMIALWEADGVRVSHLGERLGLESNTLTPVLKRMEGLGLLERKRDRSDERQVLLHLTDKGRALENEASGLPACVLEATGLDPAELITLRNEIERIRAKLESATGR
ncbi:MarR family winged helix-turn-helix transcriptional regulator [Maricaulis alexandrii]|uniref:MarR family winged helix-turn-helix transcriptional regulator n=1 Tax=Maricaulis alexandrii TaxID=2570354 RepID=UPI0011087EA1|nr:MarR family transcriptional regulator [Maricaulis alexandrii]